MKDSTKKIILSLSLPIWILFLVVGILCWKKYDKYRTIMMIQKENDPEKKAKLIGKFYTCNCPNEYNPILLKEYKKTSSSKVKAAIFYAISDFGNKELFILGLKDYLELLQNPYRPVSSGMESGFEFYFRCHIELAINLPCSCDVFDTDNVRYDNVLEFIKKNNEKLLIIARSGRYDDVIDIFKSLENQKKN
jgi:hypothetical protein